MMGKALCVVAGAAIVIFVGSIPKIVDGSNRHQASMQEQRRALIARNGGEGHVCQKRFRITQLRHDHVAATVSETYGERIVEAGREYGCVAVQCVSGEVKAMACGWILVQEIH
jgi:hypothetical protein